MTSLANLRLSLTRSYLRDPNYSIFPVELVDEALNDGALRVQKELMYSIMGNEVTQSPTIVAGTAEYALDGDFVTAKVVTWNGAELQRTTKEDLRKQHTDLTVQGTPSHYYLYNNKIGFIPVPNASATVVVELNQKLATITAVVDSTLLPTYEPAMKAYAAYKLWLPINFEKAQIRLQEAEKEADKQRFEALYTDQNIRFTTQR